MPGHRLPNIRSRGEGETSVRAAFSATTIIRPAVMFGPDDAFLTSLIKMLQMFPIFPMFGRGRTALQPSYVEDVAEAIVRAFDAPEAGMVYELGGPAVKDVLVSAPGNFLRGTHLPAFWCQGRRKRCISGFGWVAVRR